MNLDIGGQNNRDDQEGKWTIVDLHAGADIRVNLETAPLPLEPCTVDNIYSSHCIEHIEPNRLRSVFSELYRVLKEGGRISHCGPELSQGCFLLLLSPLGAFERAHAATQFEHTSHQDVPPFIVVLHRDQREERHSRP